MMRSPEPPLLQTEQSQFPQSLLIRLMLQNPHSYIALFWTRSGPQCLFCSEKPKTEHNIRVEYRGTITSLLLLAAKFLIQGRMSLIFLATCALCWPMVWHGGPVGGRRTGNTTAISNSPVRRNAVPELDQNDSSTSLQQHPLQP